MTRQGTVVVRGGTVVPLDGTRRWATADVRLSDGKVAEIAATIPAPPGAEIVDARDALVLPGFVQAHVHVVQSLVRNRAEGLALLPWLRERIWPYEAALSRDEVGAAARLGIAELLAGGTTTVLDMGTTHDQDGIFAAADEMGIRFASGKCHMDVGEGVPPGLLEDTDESLAEAERLGAHWHGAAAGRLRYAVAPRFVLSCTRDLMAGAVSLARRHGYLLHTHAGENPVETALVREVSGMGNVEFLAELGIGGRDTVLAHCVHLEDHEVGLLAAQGTGIAHCPGANLKLASGIADVPRLLAAGARIGLGADGPPCNNRLSVFHEMALAGTLHNLRHGACALDPWTVLELATCRGAAAIGLGDEIGSLQPGRRADVVVLRTDTWAMEPGGDPAAMVVYGGGVASVRHAIVDGRVVVRDGELVSADAAAIRREARAAARAVADRLGWQ